MPDKCPKCGGVLEPGDVKCPACNAELPEPSDPPPPQKAAVLAATMLPLIFLVVFLLFIGGIIFAGVKIYRGMNKPSANAAAVAAPSPVQVERTPDAAVPPMISKPVVDVPPPPPPVLPVIPAQPPVPVAVALPDAPLPPPPILDDFHPQIALQSSPVVLRGRGLTAVDHVQLLSTHGAASADAKFIHMGDNELVVTVPKISFENDALCVVVGSPGGIVAVIDQHMGATPWGTDGHLHDTAVIDKENDEIETHDNMVLIAREGSAFSVGDKSTAFLEKNVTVKGHGKNCHIYYVGHVELAPGVSREGMTEVPSLQVYEDQDAFRVKPAPPDVDQ